MKLSEFPLHLVSAYHFISWAPLLFWLPSEVLSAFFVLFLLVAIMVLQIRQHCN